MTFLERKAPLFHSGISFVSLFFLRLFAATIGFGCKIALPNKGRFCSFCNAFLGAEEDIGEEGVAMVGDNRRYRRRH